MLKVLFLVESPAQKGNQTKSQDSEFCLVVFGSLDQGLQCY